MTPLIYTYDDLQRMFALPTYKATWQQVSRWREHHGFPQALPGARGRFPRAAVDDWMRAKGMLPAITPPIFATPANDQTTTDYGRFLAHAYK